MRSRLAFPFLLLVVALATAPAVGEAGEEQARRSALEFGRGLLGGDASLLASLLPSQGKIRLKLNLLGPEEGAYSARQVEAVLDDFFRQGTVRTYDLLRLECAEQRYALAHARAGLTDRNGRRVEIDLDLTFQPEGDGWVLREIRENPS